MEHVKDCIFGSGLAAHLLVVKEAAFDLLQDCFRLDVPSIRYYPGYDPQTHGTGEGGVHIVSSLCAGFDVIEAFVCGPLLCFLCGHYSLFGSGHSFLTKVNFVCNHNAR